MVRIFRHYIETVYLWLALFESILLFLSIYAGQAYRYFVIGSYVQSDYSWLTAALFAFIMISAMTATGMYQRRTPKSELQLITRTAMSFLLGVLTMSLIFYSFPMLFIGRGVFGLAVAFSIISVLVTRMIFIRLADQHHLKRRILVLGTGNNARHIEKLDKSEHHYEFEIVNYMRVKDEKVQVDKSCCIDQEEDLLTLCERLEVDEIVIAMDDRRKRLPLHDLLDCKMAGIEVADLPTFFEKEAHVINLDVVDIGWLLFNDGFTGGGFQEVSSRIFDILASLFLLALAWPFMIITALALIIESRGKEPVLYKQQRVGLNGAVFEVLKFRSMRADAEADGKAVWASQNDNRITPVGGIIRLLRIDELPQILNVFRGDMSFVGPRPERPQFVEQLGQQIRFYHERHRVKPGITGWAQLCYNYGASVEDSYEKLKYDLYYVKNKNLFLDMMILLQTAEVILWRKGSR